MTETVFADDAAIAKAVELLNQGRLVAFPTETVYGLGADAGNAEAVTGIFKAKGRPADHPLIVHIANPAQLSDWASTVPATAQCLAKRFWPGPLTLILKKRPEVPNTVTGGQDTVGLRIPDNPVALRLLRAFGGGIAAPSANRFKRVSPTQASHVAEELDGLVDLILDGGPCRVGVESTIIDLSGASPLLLRPGSITKAEIEQELQCELTVISTTSNDTPRAPGQMAVHYAPTTPTRLCPSEQLNETIRQLSEQGNKIGLLAFRFEPNLSMTIIHLPETAEAYAQGLYAALRELDRLGLDVILVEQPPESNEWHAINDRLKKAAAAF
ncbi:L-threonylcarbamoyladenylate synthase [Methylotuvimicrobium buryatense]|uniref:Threonylcarbamoyl-AMP synthase n=1 Tax=Methylotuvimicrobium buryatense TaxID=95641 RepID=A0A4P9UKP7_METBY|nr:L-threonylcarbamoyladenylate synthase [Methylotuvimicrobium buryatense]QCW81822.1 threonylcarbamoyl-AMP synthase [Methylotuvimicrobium buryatense]